MKPPPFEYRRPHSLDEALSLLGRYGEDAKPLAGGQSLIPLLAMRLAHPAVLVDVERVPELGGIRKSGSSMRIGATTKQVEIERAADVPDLIKEAVRHIGHFQIRNRGTIGGSIAHGDPAAEWPALAVAYDAQLVVSSAARGTRQIAAREFFLGPLTTVLAADELIVEIVIPNVEDRAGFAEVERRSGDFALVGAVASADRLVVFGAGSRPQRLEETERLAAASRATPAQLAETAESEIEAIDDIHASAAYRRRVGARLVAEVVRRSSA